MKVQYFCTPSPKRSGAITMFVLCFLSTAVPAFRLRSFYRLIRSGARVQARFLQKTFVRNAKAMKMLVEESITSLLDSLPVAVLFQGLRLCGVVSLQADRPPTYHCAGPLHLQAPRIRLHASDAFWTCVNGHRNAFALDLRKPAWAGANSFSTFRRSWCLGPRTVRLPTDKCI